jgi:hypothetical protein
MSKAGEILYGRTPQGQCLYDALLSSMTAVAVHRKYPRLSREFVLKLRRDFKAKASNKSKRRAGRTS